MSAESINFDRAADYYDATRGFPPGHDSEIAKTIAQTGQLSPDSRVLEIGIGTGRIALPLAAHVNAICGIDLSRNMMARLREKQTGGSIYLAQGDATQLPYADHVFDAAVVAHVFHLMARPELGAAELARVLRPGAPLLHCRNVHGDEFRVVYDAWNASVGNKRNSQWQGAKTLLPRLGWQMPQEPTTYSFSTWQSPNELLERYSQRLFSATWQMSDDVLAAGIAAMKAVIAAYFDDPDQPVETTGGFMIETYFPPTG